MSRKHAPLPDSDLLTVTKAIGWRRNELLAEGKQPVAVVLDAALWEAYRPMWGNCVMKSLLGMPVERDPQADGWRIRVA